MGEPVFNKHRRYINKEGSKFGKGVWSDGKGTIIKPGEGRLTEDKKKVIQYNTDGSKTIFTREQWHHKKTLDHEIRVLQNDRKWGIPNIPEKMLTLSIDNNSPTSRNRGAQFSENVLDSIAVNSKRAGIPFSVGLGIVSTESTIGSDPERTAGRSLLPWLGALSYDNTKYNSNARNISYKGYYSPSILISNWTQLMENPFNAYEYTPQLEVRKTPRTEGYYDEDFEYSVGKSNRYTLEDKSPLQSGFELYKENPRKYNPNDPEYPSKVEANRRELINYSPEIKAYMQKNNLHSEEGNLNNWSNLSQKDKAEMMKVAIQNGITTLPEIREAYNKFAEGGPTSNWTIQDEANYKAWRSKLPKNLRNTNANDYNMRAAYKAGMQPQWNGEDKSYHLGSRDPQSGRILKAPHHPTYLMALLEDAKLGYYPTMDKHGNTYTETWEGNKHAYGGNLFGDGGDKSSKTASNTDIAMTYLRSKGMSHIAASAIVGTLQAESGLNPAIHAQMKGDDGEGLAQWTGSRKNQFWSALEKIEPGAKKKYSSIAKVPLERQLDVIMTERPDITFAINNAKDVYTATDIMLRGYENGGGNASSLASKGQMNSIYGKWNNGYDKQFNTRLGYAKKLLATDPSRYTISQEAFDALNADINNIDLSGLSSSGLPTLGVPTMDNPDITYNQPTVSSSNPKTSTSNLYYEYNPEQERLDNLRSMSNTFKAMGIENPFMDTFRQADSYRNNPLMAVANIGS